MTGTLVVTVPLCVTVVLGYVRKLQGYVLMTNVMKVGWEVLVVKVKIDLTNSVTYIKDNVVNYNYRVACVTFDCC